MSDRDKAIERLLAEHFAVEPGLRKIGVFSNPDDDVLRLIEVNDGTIPTGAVQPFVFEPTHDTPWRIFVADVTPDEWERIGKEIGLPSGWPKVPLRVYERPRKVAG